MPDHSERRKSIDGPSFSITPKWEALFLVCRDCRKRKNGPDVKAKALGSVIKKGLSDLRPRPRVVLTSCLGLCPKNATAIAAAGRGEPPRLIAVESRDELEEALVLYSPLV